MSTRVFGLRAPDQKWKAMKAVWDACAQAKVAVPRAVEVFFNGESPRDDGVEVPFNTSSTRNFIHGVEQIGGDPTAGFRVELAKLPKDLTHIVFENSW